LTLQQYLNTIKRDGLKIDTVYDIGANNGTWSTNLKKSTLSDSYFYLFEANPIHEKSLSDTGLPYFMGVLSRPGMESVEYYLGNTTGDSYYRENTSHYDNIDPTTMPAMTLDSIVEAAEMPIPNFIKLDTQGSELDILKGAESILPEVDLIFMECPLAKYNIGAPNMQDYLDYMASQGFVASTVCDVPTNDDRILVQIDIMFINMKTKDRLYGASHATRFIA
jgi:FkbM family methyltransferase